LFGVSNLEILNWKWYKSSNHSDVIATL